MGMDLTGKRFGKWLVLRELEKVNKTVRTWLCRCECGTEKQVRQPHLRSGRSKGCVSCGNTKHGMHKHELYETWLHMKDRCNNPNNSGYKWYGGRGIKVCERWSKDFTSFVEDMGDRPKNTTLDRIYSKGDYEPSNCRWSDCHTQAVNKGMLKTNTSGYKGISRLKESGKWRARIVVHYQEIHLGTFNTLEEAIKSRKEAELKYFKGVS